MDCPDRTDLIQGSCYKECPSGFSVVPDDPRMCFASSHGCHEYSGLSMISEDPIHCAREMHEQPCGPYELVVNQMCVARCPDSMVTNDTTCQKKLVPRGTVTRMRHSESLKSKTTNTRTKSIALPMSLALLTILLIGIALLNLR